MSEITIVTDGVNTGVFLNKMLIICGVGETTKAALKVADTLSKELNVTPSLLRRNHDEFADWETLLTSAINEASKETYKVLCDKEIKDWRFGEGYEASDLPKGHADKYRCLIQQSKHSDAFYIQIHKADRTDINLDNAEVGLSCFLEIRNGVPAISIGLHPDEHTIHVYSNNENELAVIPEGNDFYWADVEYTENNYRGLCLKA